MFVVGVYTTQVGELCSGEIGKLSIIYGFKYYELRIGPWFETHIAYAIIVKCLCKGGQLEEAEAYVNAALVGSGKELHGSEVSFLVGALCESIRLSVPFSWLPRFGNFGLIPLENAHGVWIRYVILSFF